MAVNLSPIGNGAQYFTTGGLPLNGGFLNAYQAGTTTRQATYTTNAGNVANANPIQLGVDGRPPNEIWLTAGVSYKLVLTDASGNVLATYDNLVGINDNSSISSSTGSSQVGFIAAGTGTVARTAQDKLRDIVSAADFGFLPTATSAVNKLALQTAINSLGATGGEIYIPKGAYSVDPGITVTNTQKNITLTGAGSAMGYEGTTAGTKITFTAGTIGFDLTTLSSAGNYTMLRNMSVSGGGVCATGIKLQGMALLEHLDATACTNAGIWLFDNVNQTCLSHVSSSYNAGGYGLLIGGTGNTGLNTIFSFAHCNFRNNLVGIRITNCMRIKFDNCVIESNTNEGLQINKPAATQCDYIKFSNCWFENNWTGGGATNYNVSIDSVTHDFAGGGPNFVEFDSCMFSATGSTKAVNVISAFIANFNYCGGTGAVDLGVYCTAAQFWNWNGGTITDSGNRNWVGSTYRSGLEGGGPLFPTVYAKAISINGTGTSTLCATGTPTTCYTMPNSTQMRYYWVFAKVVTGTSSATNYSAYALIAADTTTKILQQVSGVNLIISLSGMNVQVLQATGGNNFVEVSVLPVFSVF